MRDTTKQKKLEEALFLFGKSEGCLINDKPTAPLDKDGLVMVLKIVISQTAVSISRQSMHGLLDIAFDFWR